MMTQTQAHVSFSIKVYNNTEYVYLLSISHGFDSLPGFTSSELMHVNLKFALHK